MELGNGMSFVRDYHDGESYAVVGLAIGGPQDITVNGVRNGTYRDAVTGAAIEASAGTLSFHVKANSAGIYVLNFCHSRNLSTEGLGLSMDWERNQQPSVQARVRYQLRLPQGFPDKYRSGILKAVELCAVKKNVQNPPEFVTEIVN